MAELQGTDHDPPATTPQAARERLTAGNRRWVSGMVRHPHSSVGHREKVATGQSPFALVFSCIDSRVPPEMVFDRGLGDVLVVRTPAQTADNLALGSIELGVEELGAPLVVVMGHQRCGAVTAAIEAFEHHDGRAPGHIQAVVSALEPAYRAAVAEPGPDLVDTMVRAQTALTVARLGHQPLLQPRLRDGRLVIAGGYYSLDTGVASLGA